jgi:hypothetical protein
MPLYELIGCPATPGWKDQDRAALEWEEMQPDFKRSYPKAAQALSEYQDAKPDHCVLLSGLREYPDH